MSYFTFLNQPFTDITADSRAVKSGSLFLAYPGARHDGRDFISQVIQAGATAVVWEKLVDKKPFSWHAEWRVANFPVENLKQRAGEIAAQFYQQPSKQCAVIGVTGTNGKTSVSQWIAQCLTYLGKKTAVIGTIGQGFVDKQEATSNTTPDAILLQKQIAAYVAAGASAVAMEVSSHGLDQGRVNGMTFEVAVLTNLTRDHLDYHQTMDAYAKAKQQLFDWPGLKTAVINADDVFGADLIARLKSRQQAYLAYRLVSDLDEALAVEGVGAQIIGTNLVLSDTGLTMQVHTSQGVGQLKAQVIGTFNAYNLLAVLGALLSLNISLSDALDAITTVQSVVGRMQQFGGGMQPLVVVDYAHTPDALEKVLQTLRQQMQVINSKLICVFGCGGDRDKGKRGEMGAVVAEFADVIWVTSDNPRSEAPEVIIEDIVCNIQTPFQIEVDRAQAIGQAIRQARAGDIMLIAGKGHENYQEIAGVKYPFSDEQVAKTALDTYHPLEVVA